MDCPFDCAVYAQYSLEIPYPNVEPKAPNRRYAQIVSGAFGGKGSEMTAITQYGAHRLLLRERPEAYRAYQYIAYVEMIHWNLLGTLIHRLGMYPTIRSCETGCWWNGSFPAYRQKFAEIIEADIAGEKDAIAHYRRMMERIDDQAIQSLFARIILDEEKHIEILNGLYRGA